MEEENLMGSIVNGDVFCIARGIGSVFLFV